jgi:hypothetical protein
MLVRLLRNKFAKLPAAIVKRIEATDRIDLLDTWFDQASAAKRVEDLSFLSEPDIRSAVAIRGPAHEEPLS